MSLEETTEGDCPPTACSRLSDTSEVSALAAKIDPSVLEHDAYATMTNLAIRLERERDAARRRLEQERQWMHRKMEAARALCRVILSENGKEINHGKAVD